MIPSWFEKVKRAGVNVWRWQPLRRALALYLLARVALSLWAALVLWLVPAETGPALERPFFNITPLDRGLAGWLLGPWQRFDTVHYITLATSGYQAHTVQTVFPPFYPLLIRIIGDMLGRQYLLAALLISNVCAVGYLAVLFVLAGQEVGPQAARKTQLYALLYPWAFVLLAGYSESLFLLLVALAFWAAWRGRGLAAGVCGALAALTRLQGGALVLPLLFLAWWRYRRGPSRAGPQPPPVLSLLRLDFLWPFLPAVASAGFLLGRAAAGIEPIAVTYATLWQHTSAPPWVGMSANVRNMLVGVAHPTDYLDLVAAGFAAVLVLIAWRRLHPAYALYMTIAWLFDVSHIRTPHPMCSVGRHMIELFPIFFLLGRWGERSAWINRLIVYPSLSLWLWLSGQFVLWGWVG